MQESQTVTEMANEVLARQARFYAKRTGRPFEEALKVIGETEAGRQLARLRDGPHRDERAQQWQQNLPRERAEERGQARQEERAWGREQKRAKERNRARLDAWERFMRAERRELRSRTAGQLAELLGEARAGEAPAALRRLAAEDRRQAEEGLVALMSNGKVSYKHLEELTVEDMPARRAASSLRRTWLKGRLEAW